MKARYLYILPLVWFLAGTIYVRSIPKNGFAGVGEVFWMLLITVLLLLVVIIYHLVHRRTHR